MAVPGTGSTNQTLTFAAAKKLAGKAHTSNLREIYNETIPSNVQINVSTILGEAIPQTVTTDTLYQRFSASDGGPTVVEYVEFYVQSIAGTTYDANTGSFGDVGFGGGDEAQTSGPHGYQLVLTSSYEASSSNPAAGTGYFVDNQVVHQSNGGLQLVNPSFGPQTGNNYGLQIYTAHPDDGGLQIPTTSPIEWSPDYYNGVIFVQDYISTAVPTYARGFIYIGKYTDTLISEASSSGGGGGGADGQGPINSLQFHTGSGGISGSANLTFTDNTLFVTGTLIVSGAIEANTFEIISTTVTEINQSGSTAFGDTNDDTHHFTGSLAVFSSSADLFAVDVENKSTKIKTGLTLNRTAVTTNYSVLSSDYYIGIDTATPSAQITASLPDASTLNDGQVFVFKDEGGAANTHNIVISASSGQTIDNRNQVVLESPYSSLSLYCNGTDKFFIV